MIDEKQHPAVWTALKMAIAKVARGNVFAQMGLIITTDAKAEMAARAKRVNVAMKIRSLEARLLNSE